MNTCIVILETALVEAMVERDYWVLKEAIVSRYLTKGYGYAVDFVCVAADGTYTIEKQANGIIAGYCEWTSEEPQDGVFPEWCPL